MRLPAAADTAHCGIVCFWCGPSPLTDRLTAALPMASPAAGGGRPPGPEVVFRNGTIRTMAGPAPVEALAIRGGRILAAGPADRIDALSTAATEVVDLQGRTVLPGLIDPHHHYTLAAVLTRLLIDVGYAAFSDKAAALTHLQSAAATTPAGQWVAAGFYDNLLQGGDLPAADLDTVSAAHPVFVMYVNGHVGAANTVALQRVGIGDDVGTLPGGGHFGRGADGHLNGLMYEQPALMRFVGAAVPPTTPELIATALTGYAAAAAAAGNTTLHEPGTIKPDWVPHLAELSNTLAVRLSGSFSTDAAEAGAPYAALGPPSAARRIAGTRFSLYGMKLWADGSNQAEMAAQTQPYLHSTGKGAANYTTEQMTQLCRSARAAGWPVLIHCQGDAAVDEALDAIEQAYGAHPDTGINRLEHATMARADQIARMKSLGVEPSFIPDFVHLYGAAYREQIFGSPRAEFMSPFGAAAQAALPFSLHSDAPAAGLPVNPLRHVQTAVTRRCAVDGSVVGADLRITVDQAVRAVTATAARHLGLAERLGTLEAGKEADLTILEADPYTVDPDAISAIAVSQTWVAGQRMHGAE